MKKGHVRFIGLLLTGAAVLIHVMVKEGATSMDRELIEFFAGFLFAIGIGTVASTLFKRAKVNS